MRMMTVIATQPEIIRMSRHSISPIGEVVEHYDTRIGASAILNDAVEERSRRNASA